VRAGLLQALRRKHTASSGATHRCILPSAL
jgi:hypothetical protein